MTKPVGAFLFAGRVNGMLCDSTVTWASVFVPTQGYANNAPVVSQSISGEVFVSAPVTEDDVTLGDVSPGVLTLTPTVHNDSGDTPLAPLTLNLVVS